MKTSIFPYLSVTATLLAVSLAGCGGGSSSGPTRPTTPPAPTATPVAPTNVSVLVQLRDPAGAPVNGIVTLGARQLATTGGNASFTNAAAGAQTVSAEVNGTTYNRNFVATVGANTVQIAVDPTAGTTTGTTTGGTTGTTPPAPPSF